jgi:hypothetical protein
MTFGRVILGLLCAICLSAGASAAALLEETLRSGHVALHLVGRIESKDAASFVAAVNKLTGAGKHIDVVSLNSTGKGEECKCSASNRNNAFSFFGRGSLRRIGSPKLDDKGKKI